MHRRSIAALAWLALCGLSNADECLLGNASYTEERSGSVIYFHPKDVSQDGITIMGLFDLRLPNIKKFLQGEISWNAGRYARPDGAIAQHCTEEESAEWPNSCWLWMGGVYAIGNETAAMIEDPDMPAPNILLFAGFGRSLLMNEDFGRANPDAFAFDVFMLNGCPDVP